MEEDKIRYIIREVISESFFDKSILISLSEEYGSVEGVIHNDIERIKNWFLNRNIDFNKYIKHVDMPIAFLNNINVYEEYRGEGYGNELYSYFESECYDNDVKFILLESDSSESQLEGFDLDKWYESFDFEIIGKEGGNSIMIKRLD